MSRTRFVVAVTLGAFLCGGWLATPAAAQFKLPKIKIPDRVQKTVDKTQQVAEQTDFTPEQEQAIGKEVGAKIVHYFHVYDNPALAAYVRKVGAAVAMQCERQEIPYRFELLDDAEDVNAFSTPGGYIFVTKGLLQTITSESQLAGVLAHEVGHVAGKHVLKALQRGRMIQVGVKETSAFNPGSKYMEDIANKILVKLIDSGLDPNDEYDADQRAVKYAYAAGYRPDGLGMFLEKFAKLSAESEAKTQWLGKTHPPATERMQHMAQFITAQQMQVDGRADLPERYTAVAATITPKAPSD